MTPIERARGVGPVVSAELRRAGIATREALVAMGWQEAWVRLIECYPERLNRNCAYGLAAAVLDVDWRELPAEVREEIRVMAQQLRRHLIV